jgi:hypothetical protein
MGNINFDLLSEADFHSLCLEDLGRSVISQGGRFLPGGHSVIDAEVIWPNGEKWGVMVQTARILRESLQRTLERKDQVALRSASLAMKLIPAFALTFVTSDEPHAIQIVLVRLDELTNMTTAGVKWLCFSEKGGIILHFNTNKGYIKMIQTNPHVRYSSWAH